MSRTVTVILAVFIFAGVLKIIEGAAANPVDAHMIGWGVAWLFFAEMVAGAAFLIVALLGTALAGWGVFKKV